MELKRITVENFRQFYGNQSIEFAKGDQNITIVFGDNGKGKTGLFRAMMFGLFGDKNIEQDDKTKKNYLINLNALSENNGAPIEAKVSVMFSHLKFDYEISRSIKAIKKNNSILEQVGEVELIVFDRKNSSQNAIYDLDEIDERINYVFEKNIREFFFFDAEKIDMLSNSKSEVKTIVREGIVKILQIDLVEESVKALEKILRRMDKNIADNAKNIDIKRKESILEETIDKHQQAISSIENYDKELRVLTNELQKFESKIDENSKVKVIKDKIDEKKKNKKQLLDNLNTLMATIIGTDFKKYHQLLLRNNLAMLNENTSIELKDEKSFIPKQLLKFSLDKNECFLCKHNIEHDHEAKDEIESLLQVHESTDTILLKLLITNSISEYDPNNNSLRENLEEYLSKIEEIRSDIVEIDRQIENHYEKINDIVINNPDIDELERHRTSLLKDREELRDNIFKEEIKIEKLEKEITSLKADIELLQSRETGLKKEILRKSYVEKLHKSLKSLTDEYCDEMRVKLMKESTKILKGLIDEQDKNIIDKIHINEKYEIEIIGWQQENITQDISQGQRQMVSLALIAALSTLAAGDSHKIDFPLFMDTPFGRISGKNRDNLIVNMPKYTSQWILLLTDTELTATEEIIFKETGKLGKSYELIQVKEGYTKIHTKSIEDQLGKRGYN